MPGIGQLNEKPLHAALKAWCALPGDRFEVPVDGYVVDVVRGDLLLEIQTRSFGAIRPKLEALVHSYRVRLIHPIAREKWIVKLPEDAGGVPTRRKSPKQGRLEDVFREAVRIPGLLLHPKFSLEVVLTRQEEVRRFDGERAWRRRGWVVEEHRLLEVVERTVLDGPASWQALLPRVAEPFTTREVGDALGVRLDLAQKMAYTLHRAGLLKAAGKRGRARLYRAA